MSKLLPNFTPLPNILIDEWMSQLSGTAFKIVCIIARQTYGWELDKQSGRRKKFDWISYSQLCEKSGMTATPISNALRELEEKSYIEIRDSAGNLLTTKEQRLGKRLLYCIKIDTSLESREVSDNLSRNSNRETRIEPLEKLDTQNKLYTKENYTKENNSATAVAEPNKLNDLIPLFEKINPHYEQFFSNKSERDCLQKLVNKYTYPKIERLLKELPGITEKPYAPRITSPFSLYRKMGDLILFMKQEKLKGGGVVDARLIR